MQSRITLLSNENDTMSSEIKSLRQSLSEAEKVNVEWTKDSKIMTAKFQLFAEKLYTKNKRMDSKLRKVKKFVSCIQLKEKIEKEKSLAVMLNIHEEMMRKKGNKRELKREVELEDISFIKKYPKTNTDSRTAALKFSTVQHSGQISDPESPVDEIVEINKMISIDNQNNLHETVEVKEIGKEIGENTNEHILFFPNGTKKVGIRFQNVPFNDDTEKENVGQSSQKSGDIILVCGVKGFDSSVNIVPSIGARLVAIDGVALTVSNQMTLDDIRRKVSSKISVGDSFSLVFRNDKLTETQRNLLMKGVQQNMMPPEELKNIKTPKKSLGSLKKIRKKIRTNTGYHLKSLKNSAVIFEEGWDRI